MRVRSQSFFGPASSAPVDNRSYVLASHERLLVHVDLSTAETDVSSALLRRSKVTED